MWRVKAADQSFKDRGEHKDVFLVFLQYSQKIHSALQAEH